MSNNVCLYFSVWARRGTELEQEFSDVKPSSSYSAQPGAAASINTVNHWSGLPDTNQGTPPRTHTVKKKEERFDKRMWARMIYI